MPHPLSPDVGSHLLKATRSRDLDEALETVLTEYLTLKIEKLQQTTNRLEKKWGMSFSTFKRRLSENDLSEDAYSQEVEEDFWEWEEAETLKAHYQKVQEEWT
jgi:DNA-binding NtrC family response regulator